ncbi:hypothetical protein ACP4J4_19030 (plasmid) [Aureimonas ureilytica]|uniref:hypothetical protein n=1 Tax=Aureimonas ureilytica TaxID=401562 RepID=UPI003CF88211
MALGFLAQGTLALSTSAHAGTCKRFVAVSATPAGGGAVSPAGQAQGQGCKVVADRLSVPLLAEPEGAAPAWTSVIEEAVPHWTPDGLDRPPKGMRTKA